MLITPSNFIFTFKLNPRFTIYQLKLILSEYFRFKMSTFSTYGSKPREYVIEGVRYMIGAEVGNYFRCHRGKLYKQYPNMWRKVATAEEKKIILEMNGGTNTLSSNVMLVKAEEVDEILGGNEEKYKGRGYGQPSISLTPKANKDVTGTPGNRVLRGLSTPSWMNNAVSR